LRKNLRRDTAQESASVYDFNGLWNLIAGLAVNGDLQPAFHWKILLQLRLHQIKRGWRCLPEPCNFDFRAGRLCDLQCVHFLCHENDAAILVPEKTEMRGARMRFGGKPSLFAELLQQFAVNPAETAVAEDTNNVAALRVFGNVRNN